MRWYGKARARARDRVKLLLLLQSLSLLRLWGRKMETQTRKIQRRQRLNAVGNKPWKRKDEWANGWTYEPMDISGNRKCEKSTKQLRLMYTGGNFEIPVGVFNNITKSIVYATKLSYCFVDYTFSFQSFFSFHFFIILNWNY